MEIFEEVGIERVRSKSIILTQYLQYLIQSQVHGRERCSFYECISCNIHIHLDTGICHFTLLTPLVPEERGAQLSLRPHHITAQEIHDQLVKVGVLVSIRKRLLLFVTDLVYHVLFQIDIRDDIIRIAPAPLYNSFYDIFRFVSLLKQAILTLKTTSDG